MARKTGSAVVRDPTRRGATIRMLFIAGATAATLVAAGACSESLDADEALHATSMSVFAGDLQSAEVARPTLNPLTVEVRDQHGRLMAGVTVNFATTGNASILGSPAISDALGQASIMYTMGTVSGPYTVTASTPGINDQPAFTLTARPGPAINMLKHDGDSQAAPAGTQLPAPFVAKILDLFGNPVAGQTVTWVAIGGGTLSQSTSITDQDGEATVYLTLGSSPGTHTVIARAANLPDVQFLAIAN